MAAGVYSSVFIATPLLVHMKEREPGVKAGDARAMRHHSRRDADRFANVPVFREDMPIHDDPGAESPTAAGAPARGASGASVSTGGNRPVSPGAPGRFTAGERPASARPVADSTSAHRPQPKRKPRSQRGKH
jgi:preprotein translocase subunit SecF